MERLGRDVLGNRHPAYISELAGWILYDVAHMSMNEWDRALLERDLAKRIRAIIKIAAPA